MRYFNMIYPVTTHPVSTMQGEWRVEARTRLDRSEEALPPTRALGPHRLEARSIDYEPPNVSDDI